MNLTARTHTRPRGRLDARAQLRAALDGFKRLGAEPWAQRAQTELNANGEHIPRHDPAAAERLTPQELQIALAVAGGATNREAATTTMFLTGQVGRDGARAQEGGELR